MASAVALYHSFAFADPKDSSSSIALHVFAVVWGRLAHVGRAAGGWLGSVALRWLKGATQIARGWLEEQRPLVADAWERASQAGNDDPLPFVPSLLRICRAAGHLAASLALPSLKGAAQTAQEWWKEHWALVVEAVARPVNDRPLPIVLISGAIFLGPQILLIPLIALHLLFLCLLALIGFRRGIVAGSLAAWYQSVYYGGNTPAGSLFSIFQSMGMKYNALTLGFWGLAVIRSALDVVHLRKLYDDTFCLDFAKREGIRDRVVLAFARGIAQWRKLQAATDTGRDLQGLVLACATLAKERMVERTTVLMRRYQPPAKQTAPAHPHFPSRTLCCDETSDEDLMGFDGTRMYEGRIVDWENVVLAVTASRGMVAHWTPLA
ncbi:hypothetical protein HMN09_00482800 [Mycena chlorophos]|uniref:Uncharacterized protein n=1 Tax=Mycena chlorophos TaxID=658473 RepID=A0A8H6TIT2_MYCCL|nr:hypothetical protein HMN09_00482800 [Mycena chlorophos]